MPGTSHPGTSHPALLTLHFSPCDNDTCSPYQVTWNVSPHCQSLDLASLHGWCADNVFEEDHGHGVRTLVTPLELLSAIE